MDFTDDYDNYGEYSDELHKELHEERHEEHRDGTDDIGQEQDVGGKGDIYMEEVAGAANVAGGTDIQVCLITLLFFYFCFCILFLLFLSCFYLFIFCLFVCLFGTCICLCTYV